MFILVQNLVVCSSAVVGLSCLLCITYVNLGGLLYLSSNTH